MKTLQSIQYVSISILLAYSIEQVILFMFNGAFLSEVKLSLLGYIMHTVYYASFISSSLLWLFSKAEALGPVKSVKDMSIEELTNEPAFKRRTPTNFNDNNPPIGI
jgi:hypothetical protein